LSVHFCLSPRISSLIWGENVKPTPDFFEESLQSVGNFSVVHPLLNRSHDAHDWLGTCQPHHVFAFGGVCLHDPDLARAILVAASLPHRHLFLRLFSYQGWGMPLVLNIPTSGLSDLSEFRDTILGKALTVRPFHYFPSGHDNVPCFF